MGPAELALLNGLIGPFLPPLVSVINQPGWPRWGRALATVGVCAVVGTLTAAVAGDLVGLGWPAAVLACASSAIAAYHVWWRGSGITTALERVTSPPLPPPRPRPPSLSVPPRVSER